MLEVEVIICKLQNRFIERWNMNFQTSKAWRLQLLSSHHPGSIYKYIPAMSFFFVLYRYMTSISLYCFVFSQIYSASSTALPSLSNGKTSFMLCHSSLITGPQRRQCFCHEIPHRLHPLWNRKSGEIFLLLVHVVIFSH